MQRIDLKKIDPSPLNRDARSVDDLLASIRERGAFEPIKLRSKGERFEIVFGERRWRASKKLGLADIPATVEDLPTPTLIRSGKPLHTPESVAKRLGRSTQHVYQTSSSSLLGPQSARPSTPTTSPPPPSSRAASSRTT